MTAMLSRVFLLACLFASPAALGQTYPDRNVTIVVTSAAGALTDVLTRAVAQRLSEMWKQSVIVENRGGAGYSIAAQSVMRAEHEQLTPAQVAEREAEKVQLLAQAAARAKAFAEAEGEVLPVTTTNAAIDEVRGTPVINVLAGFTHADATAHARVDAERRARVAVVVEPLAQAANEVIEQQAKLKAAFYDRAVAVARVDLKALLRATPLVYEPLPKLKDVVVRERVSSHARIAFLHRAARALEASFATHTGVSDDLGNPTFGVDAPAFADLRRAVSNLRNLAHWSDTNGVDFRQARGYAQEYLRQARAWVEGAEGLARQFTALEAKTATLLEGVTPAEVTPEPKAEQMAMVRKTPAWLNPKAQTSGMASWDPRSVMRDEAPVEDDVTITPLGDGAGYRVKSTRDRSGA